MEKKTDVPAMVGSARNAGWFGGLILAVLTIPIWLLGRHCTGAAASTREGKPAASQGGTGLSRDGTDDPGKWKSRERGAPKRPELKPLTPEQREQGIAEDAAFRKQAYAAYEAALERDAATNPELRAVVDLRAEAGRDVEKLTEIRARIRLWQSVASGQGSVLNEMRPVTGMLATVRQMEDERMRAALGDPTPEVRKGLAISLVDHGLPPAAVMGGGADAAALSSLREQLFNKIDGISARPGLPADLFNRSTGALLVSEDLHRKLGARAKALASPATQNLAAQAAKDIAIHSKELEKRTQEQMRKNAAADP
ncbi:hypothetical protein OVA24_15850 [Luteolibacter sp. SL250]|uniref:hypothetical protein n=1 Tax=Luteolibacter sp. SL250 TaxID=2995170 RepID=UPI00227160C9|nr:hypothetical protein [Luteolibacter sp. SL250]WAC18703.1 hypothetical protein OVA24_15850 [Luteolibacter sp. SL250]